MRRNRASRTDGKKAGIILLIISIILFAVYLRLGFPPLVLAIFAAYLVAAGGSLYYFIRIRGRDDEDDNSGNGD